VKPKKPTPKKNGSKKPILKKATAVAAERPGKADLPPPGFGAWAHRTEIGDTVEFARELRRRMSSRYPRPLD
jgi:hypothetical protein